MYNEKLNGVERAQIARKILKRAFMDNRSKLHFSKDIDLARKFGVSRHTIYSIREEFKIPPRSERIVAKLKTMDLKQYTIFELTRKLQVKYQSLYKIIKDLGMAVKPDTSPIEYLIKYQKDRKKQRLESLNS